MKLLRQPVALVPLALFALLTLSLSCGGGGTSSGPPPPPPQPQTLQVVTTTIPAGVANKAYSASFAATGGTPPYSWSLRFGSDPLPPGLTLSSAGVLSGTPADPPSPPYYCYLQVQVNDSASHVAYGSYGMFVYGVLRIGTSSLAAGNIGVRYYDGVYANGGYPPFTYSLAPGSAPLPAGISLSASTGNITGTPTAWGNVDIDFQVQDSAPSSQTATRRLNLNILNNLVVSTTSLPVGVVGQPYNQAVQGAGGTPPYTFSFMNGFLFGLSLQLSGQVTGPPLQSGSGGFQVQITDSASPPAVATGFVQIYIRTALGINTTVLTDAIRNTLYSCGVWLQGGTPPQSLRVSSGSLPDDLHVEAVDTTNGLFYIRGTPTATGITNFTVEASDSSSPPVVVTQALAFRVFDRMVMTAPPLPPSLTGDPFSATFTATGGLPPYRWLGVSVPAGLTLDPSTGVLSGTPTAPYVGSLTIIFGTRVFRSNSPINIPALPSSAACSSRQPASLRSWWVSPQTSPLR